MSTKGKNVALALKPSGALQSIAPQSLDEVARIAKLAVMAGLMIVPTKRKRKSDEEDGDDDDGGGEDKLIATATMVILQGMEVGLPPMQALQTIALINGRPLIWGDAVPALLWRAGFTIEESIDGDGEARTARCKVTRPDGKSVERTFSVADAKRARLWDTREKIKKWGKNFQTKRPEQYEAPNDSPWFRFPDRMLAMRARGFAVKDGASDVTRGLYLREEYEANDIVDATPEPVATLESFDPPSPDEVPEPPAPDIEPEPDLEPLEDAAGACEHIRDQLDNSPAEERDAVWTMNQDMLARLPADMREELDSYRKSLD